MAKTRIMVHISIKVKQAGSKFNDRLKGKISEYFLLLVVVELSLQLVCCIRRQQRDH